jgi:xanthine dehydrogenase accessory factor
MNQLLQRAADLARRDEPFVLAVVVSRRPASSAQPGNMALITAAGAFEGWLGGSCTQPTVVREAGLALADGQPRLLVLTPDPEAERRPGVDVFPMTCHSGGSVEIYLQPVLPAPRLVVFGDSPIARALSALGSAMGYSIGAPESPTTSPLYAVVAAMGEGDEEAIRAALALHPSYLGVVASSKRFAQMRETLLAQGVSSEALDAIRCPAGVKIGARAPEEIALSILAQIVEQRRSEKPAEVEIPAPTVEATALDPICGMTVDVATAKHTAEHAGRTWYFCCGGCRTRFLAEPERYAS